LKIPKRELKHQRDLINKILTGATFTQNGFPTGSTFNITNDFIDQVYEDLNPAIIDNISEGGVYWTPYYLAQDLAVFAPRRGHVVDVCAGIGMLSYRVQQMDSYDKEIEASHV